MDRADPGDGQATGGVSMTWTQIGILLAAVVVEMGRALTMDGVQTWSDALTPAVFGAALVNLGLQVSGILSRPVDKL